MTAFKPSQLPATEFNYLSVLIGNESLLAEFF